MYITKTGRSANSEELLFLQSRYFKNHNVQPKHRCDEIKQHQTRLVKVLTGTILRKSSVAICIKKYF